MFILLQRIPLYMAIDINDRFIKVMTHYGHSGYSFSKKLGTSEAVISNIRKKKNPPNIILVQKLLNMYLEISPDWLLHGRGTLLRGEPSRAITDVPDESLSETLVEFSNRLKAIEKAIGVEK